jgi:predicted RNA polymerase sigma factor
LDDYHLFHATRADLLRQLGDPDEARAADRRALVLTTNPAERAVLQQRIESQCRLSGQQGRTDGDASHLRDRR